MCAFSRLCLIFGLWLWLWRGRLAHSLPLVTRDHKEYLRGNTMTYEPFWPRTLRLAARPMNPSANCNASDPSVLVRGCGDLIEDAASWESKSRNCYLVSQPAPANSASFLVQVVHHHPHLYDGRVS